ncbi:hypothetical protein JQS43_06440 [Natronosporangium hydrolyticum]|uniref:Uncharacterized protein n=1 Tax=Natronosporangium hydrolyticum TaxID=2811111 RepID=A0A895YIZ6_9ACTN|nr:DUF6232 family protein [Natronosporangium hydrolyticum]QSB15965.1 hypothetical protein JQS43_06440 [Natronosporangium hydrolyticum]
MIVYYQDPAVQVTSTAIEVDGRRYRLDQVRRVWFERDQRSWREIVGRGGWSLTYVLPLIGALLGFVAAFTLDVSFGTRITIAAASVLLGVLGIGPLWDPVLSKLDDSFDRGLYRHELWVEHNGVAVRLLETRDAARFGRIYRAVQRAAGA